jgi:hypothetical protein
MSHRRSLVTLAFLGLLSTVASGIAGAATPLKADLATDPGTEQIIQVPAGDYTVLITDKAPKKAYSVQVEVNFTPIPPLTAPSPLGTTSFTEETGPCAQLADDATSIRSGTDEEAVAGLVAEIGQILKAGTCTDAQKVNDAKAAVALTQQNVDDIVYTLSNGQDLKVTVTRDPGSASKTWTFVFRTPGLGSWFSSYGFVFIPNHDERYFSMLKTGTTDRYLITRSAHNSGSDFSPSLFYSWLPTNRENKAWSLGWSAGLGFDQSNPIVFLGPMLTFHQNISLVAGAVVQKQRRLNGMYSRNQEIGDNLTGDQLTEQTYKPNFFFGLSFRFSSNPFAAPSTDSKPAQKAQPKTAETPK